MDPTPTPTPQVVEHVLAASQWDPIWAAVCIGIFAIGVLVAVKF